VGAVAATYEQLVSTFTWEIPERFNIGVACSDAQPASAPALLTISPDGATREYSFGEISQLSNRVANALHGLGIERGDRVGVVLAQSVETCIAHLGIYKLGAVAVPMSVLFGPDALHHRLGDSSSRAVIADEARLERVTEVAANLGGLDVIATARVQRPLHEFARLLEDASPQLEPADTAADDPALIIYTSGTTGPPKGALHAHRVLLGHQPGFRLSHDFFPQEGDRFWTPADWAWIGGLVNALLSSLYNGRPIIAAPREGGFDPEWATALMLRAGVRNTFLPPTALKLMRKARSSVPAGTLRTVMSGGEVLGDEMLGWAWEHLGLTINEIYGQTEVNYVVGNCHDAWPVTPGSMGRPYPGHRVAIVGDDGQPAEPGAVGEIAVAVPDPVAFLGYWQNRAATADKVRDGWIRTGDLGRADEDGYFWFQGRVDDVISSAGYRIGPEEIEQSLLRHPAVAMSAVIGVPDPVRGEAVKAFIKLVDGVAATPSLEQEIQQFVRTRLAAYEYPRQIEFIDEIPLTVTGKIRRNELRRLDRERRQREEVAAIEGTETTTTDATERKGD
jgi:acetyl-CoA synthetase